MIGLPLYVKHRYCRSNIEGDAKQESNCFLAEDFLFQICFFTFLLLFGACNGSRGKNLYHLQQSKSYICSDSVIWHLHFQEGFKKDTIRVIIDADTLPHEVIICETGNNGCTNTYVVCLSDGGKFWAIVSHNGKLYKTQISAQYNSIIDIKILINKSSFEFRKVIDVNRFIGLNFHQGQFFTYSERSSCFVCW